MVRVRVIVPAVAIVLGSVASATPAQLLPVSAAASITFSTPTVVDPIHTNGEPDRSPPGRTHPGAYFEPGRRFSMWLVVAASSGRMTSALPFCHWPIRNRPWGAPVSSHFSGPRMVSTWLLRR